MANKLQFRSRPLKFVLPVTSEQYRHKFDHIELTESFEPSATPEIPGLGDYRIIAEAIVEYQEDLSAAVEEMHDLAEELNRAWVYATGQPLNAVRLVPRLVEGVKHWSGNIADLERILPWKDRGFRAHFEIGEGFSWMENTVYPLSRACEALQALRRAPPAVKTLAELHQLALDHPGYEASFLFWGKALEIVRALLSGDSLLQKESSLPADIRTALRQPLKWIYTISNKRIESRHAVRRADDATLHPRMSPTERKDFVHDADLLVRTVVCIQLGLEPFVVGKATASSKPH